MAVNQKSLDSLSNLLSYTHPYVHSHANNFVFMSRGLKPKKSTKLTTGNYLGQLDQTLKAMNDAITELNNETKKFMSTLGLSVDNKGLLELRNLIAGDSNAATPRDLAYRVISDRNFLNEAYKLFRPYFLDFTEFNRVKNNPNSELYKMLAELGLQSVLDSNEIYDKDWQGIKTMINQGLEAFASSLVKNSKGFKKGMALLTEFNIQVVNVNSSPDDYDNLTKNIFSDPIATMAHYTKNGKIQERRKSISSVRAEIRKKLMRELIKYINVTPSDLEDKPGLKDKFLNKYETSIKSFAQKLGVSDYNYSDEDKAYGEKIFRSLAKSFAINFYKTVGNLFEDYVTTNLVNESRTSLDYQIEAIVVDSGESDKKLIDRAKKDLQVDLRELKTYRDSERESGTDAIIKITRNGKTATARVQYKNSLSDATEEIADTSGIKELYTSSVYTQKNKLYSVSTILHHFYNSNTLSREDLDILGYLIANTAWFQFNGEGQSAGGDIESLINYYFSPLLLDVIGLTFENQDIKTNIIASASNLFYVFPSAVIPTVWILEEVKKGLEQFINDQELNRTKVTFNLTSNGVVSISPTLFWGQKQDAITDLVKQGYVEATYEQPILKVGQSAGEEILQTITGTLSYSIDIQKYFQTAYSLK